MTSEAELLAAVLENPNDDFPRLLLADFWDERGNPRAELIRVQLELAKRPDCLNGRRALGLTWCCVVCDQWRCQRQLLRTHGHIWAKQDTGEEIAFFSCATEAYEVGLKFGRTGKVYFHRGFVEGLECDLADWQRFGRRMVRRTPLRAVRFRDRHTLTMDSLEAWVPENDVIREVLSAGLPVAIYDRLAAPHSGNLLWCRVYDSVEEADLDLSQAALAWAREAKP